MKIHSFRLLDRQQLVPRLTTHLKRSSYRSLRGRARRDPRALGLGELDREGANRGATAVDEHGLSFFELRNVEQRLVRGQRGNPESRSLRGCNVLRAEDGGGGVHFGVLSKGAPARTNNSGCRLHVRYVTYTRRKNTQASGCALH